MSKKIWRKIHFENDEVWEYMITGSYVVIKYPGKKKYLVSHPDFLSFFGYNWNWDTIERARWKGYWPEIGPGDVKKYVESKLRK